VEPVFYLLPIDDRRRSLDFASRCLRPVFTANTRTGCVIMDFMTVSARRRTPPPGLQARGKALWRNTFELYELNPAETAVLAEICHTTDEIGTLETALASQRSWTVKGSRGQPVPHPLLGELRQHRETMRRLVRQLGLPDPVNQPVRQPKSKARIVAVRRLHAGRDSA
jgi:hypothetical protein